MQPSNRSATEYLLSARAQGKRPVTAPSANESPAELPLRPSSTQMNRNLSSFEHTPSSSMSKRPSNESRMHERQSSVVSSLASHANSETEGIAVAIDGEERNRADSNEVENLGDAPRSKRAQHSKSSSLASISGPLPVMTETPTDKGKAKHKQAPTEPSSSPEVSRDMPSSDITLKTKASSRAVPSSSRRKDVRIPEMPHADVQRVKTGTSYWSRAPVTGRLPHHGLRAHTATLVGSCVWLFGGCDSRSCFRDVWKLDLDTWIFSKPKVTGDLPPLCRAHSATLVGHRIYVFGGGEGAAYFNYIYIFDTKKHIWSRPAVSAELLSSNKSHSAAVFYKDHLVVCGGGNGSRALNDCYACDVSKPDELVWRQIETSGKAPVSRGYHSANRIGNKMLIFGGSDGAECFGDVHVLNLDTWAWTSIDLDVQSHTFARLSHTAVQVGSLLYIQGGHNGSDYTNSLLTFNMISLAFEERKTAGIGPSPRGYSVGVFYDSRLIVIGGFDGKKTYDEVYVLDLATDAFHALITRWSGVLSPNDA